MYLLRFKITTLDFPMLKLHDSQLSIVTPVTLPTECRLTQGSSPASRAHWCRAAQIVPARLSPPPSRNLPPSPSEKIQNLSKRYQTFLRRNLKKILARNPKVSERNLSAGTISQATTISVRENRWTMASYKTFVTP